jgi:hypothetical protein
VNNLSGFNEEEFKKVKEKYLEAKSVEDSAVEIDEVRSKWIWALVQESEEQLRKYESKRKEVEKQKEAFISKKNSEYSDLLVREEKKQQVDREVELEHLSATIKEQGRREIQKKMYQVEVERYDKQLNLLGEKVNELVVKGKEIIETAQSIHMERIHVEVRSASLLTEIGVKGEDLEKKRANLTGTFHDLESIVILYTKWHFTDQA